MFVQDEDGAGKVEPLHRVDELDCVVLTDQVLRGMELTVPTGEPVLDLVTVMTEIDGELPDGAPVVSHIVDKLKELVNDHVRLPALVFDCELHPEDELVAGRGLMVTVITLGAAEPELLGFTTVPDKVSVELRAVGKGGLLEPGVFVGTLVHDSQVVLNCVTDGRDVSWVPDWLKSQVEDTE